MAEEGAPERAAQLDLDAILRRRLPRGAARLLPRFLTRGLERLICQEQLNEMLRLGFPRRGSDFAAFILRHLDIDLQVSGLDGVDPKRPVIFASNHPLGGLDGIALIKVLGERYGDSHVRFLVNDMLMNVEPLRDVFLPINKYGSQGREAARLINDAYADPDCRMLVFPAGLVSRLQPGGEIADLEWHKAFVAKALEYGRDIVPVRFVALNRRRFYRTARWRKRLGLKVNIEQALLPSELCHSRGKRFEIRFGKPLTVESMRADGRSPQQLAAAIRDTVYSL